MKKVKVLIASRLRDAARAAEDILTVDQRCSVEVRILGNGHVDPLRDVNSTPDLLLLCNVQAEDELRTLMNLPTDKRPALVVFGPGQDAESIRLAMRAGARDYLTLPLNRQDLVDIVNRLVEDLESTSGDDTGNLHVFLNGKGGSGASFLATNVAHGLASDHHKVTLVDLDLQFAGLCRYLDLTPTRDLIDALQAVDEMDELAAQAFTSVHESGLRLLSCKSDNLHLNAEVATERLIRLLGIYKSFNDFVIVDLPRNIDLVNASVLENADRISIVIQQSFPHLHDTTRLLQILRQELGITNEKLTIVVNRYEKKSAILLTDIKKALRIEDIVTIPNQYRLTAESVNSGIPLLEMARRSSLTKGLEGYLRRLVETPPDKSNESALQRLFRRT